jgi:hypothetical protein
MTSTPTWEQSQGTLVPFRNLLKFLSNRKDVPVVPRGDTICVTTCLGNMSRDRPLHPSQRRLHVV